MAKKTKPASSTSKSTTRGNTSTAGKNPKSNSSVRANTESNRTNKVTNQKKK